MLLFAACSKEDDDIAPDASTTLPAAVKNALDYRNVPAAALSVYVEELGTGDVVLAWNDAEPRNPASVEKMVTTLVALDILGPAYRWKTEISLLGDVEDDAITSVSSAIDTVAGKFAPFAFTVTASQLPAR